jgi:hypothetical protein
MRRNKRRRSVIVYSKDWRAAFMTFTTSSSNEAHLRGVGKRKGPTAITAARLFLEEGSEACETNETRSQAIRRLESQGYSFVGKKSAIRVPIVDSGANIYSIEKGKECYIGWTTKTVSDRLHHHANQRQCTAAQLLDGCDRVRIVEHYAPGEWTTSGMQKREREIINNTHGCVNYLGNESVLKD